MSYLTLNNAPVVRATITMPLHGAWIADLEVDDQVIPNGPAILAAGDGLVEWRGCAYRAGIVGDTLHVRMVGGNGGLATELESKYYYNVPLRLPLLDCLLASGEILSNNSTPEILSLPLKIWTRVKGYASEIIRELADHAGASWRVLSDGTVWVGKETWPPVSIDYESIKESPQSSQMEIWTDVPVLIPGVSLNGRHITHVEHRIDENVRTTIWFEGAEQTASDDPMVAIKSLVRHLTSSIDYFAQYPARVVKQNSDGTLELSPDDKRLPGMSNVPIRLGVPGITVTVSPGSRVAIEFEAGNPSNPVATVWESKGLLEIHVTADSKIVINNGSKPVSRVGDKVDLGTWSFAGEGALTIIEPNGNTKTLSGGAALQITAMISSGADKFQA